MTYLNSFVRRGTYSPGVFSSYARLASVVAVVIVLDQASKLIITGRLNNAHVELFGGAVTLVNARNTGAAFSIFRSGGALFTVVAILVCAVILVYYRRATNSPPVVRIALGLVLGGAIGNLIDRVRLGYVVDFVDLHWWPVFNLADSAIVVGVALLAVMSLSTSNSNKVR